MKDYGFEPFEAVIALIVTQYIKSKPVSKAEMGKIINPRVIALKDWTPVNTEIGFPALAALLNAARDWYKASGRRYEEKLTGVLNEAIDQLMADFDGERYLRTEPVGFYSPDSCRAFDVRNVSEDYAGVPEFPS